MQQGLRIRRGLMLALVVLVPLLFLRTVNDPINVPKLGLLIVGVSIVAAIRLSEALQDGDVHGLKLVAVPAAALALPLVIGWLFSPYKGWALWGVYPRLLGLLPYLFVIAFGVLLAETFRGDPAPVARAAVFAAAVAGAYALIQAVGLDPFVWALGSDVQEKIVVSTLGNSNFAGAFFAITLPVGLALVAHDADRRVAMAVATGLIGIGWIVTQSQAAWAAGLAGTGVFAGFALAQRWRRARLAAAAAATGIAVVVAGTVVAGIVGVAESTIPLTIQRRGDWWQAATAITTASPVVGRGPNAFALEHPQYRTAEDVRQVGLDITDDPHSVFLSYLTGAGVIGAVGYLVALGWVVNQVRRSKSMGIMAAAFLGALTAYFIQSLVSIDTVALRTAGWTALAGFVASVTPAAPAVMPSRTKKKKARREPLRAVPALGLLVVVGLAGVWMGVQLVLSDARFAHADDLLDEGQGQPALDAYEAAISFNGNVYYRRVYGNVLGDIAVAAGNDGHVFMDKAGDAFDFVHELPQVNATLDYARTLKDWAAVEPSAAGEAADVYVLAVSYDPIDTPLLSEAATSLLELEAHQEVVAILAPVVDRLDQPVLWGSLALAHARLGNVEDARGSAERALALDPANAPALEAQKIANRSSSP